MLSAKGDEFDKLLGLELGADDYITKPFSPREVVARIKAVLRRIHELTESSKGSHLVAGNLDIDMSAFIVKLGDEVIPCTPKEIEILWTLAGNPGMVFSREHLLQSMWGYDFLGDTRAVDSHITVSYTHLRAVFPLRSVCTRRVKNAFSPIFSQQTATISTDRNGAGVENTMPISA